MGTIHVPLALRDTRVLRQMRLERQFEDFPIWEAAQSKQCDSYIFDPECARCYSYESGCIGCCTSLYKVFSKLDTSRLQNVIPLLWWIPPNPLLSRKGVLIDNILLCQQLARDNGRKGVICKLDGLAYPLTVELLLPEHVKLVNHVLQCSSIGKPFSLLK
ncbi:hypothetical protein Ancab_012580 [Ancistrocladus abbreviatus]